MRLSDWEARLSEYIASHVSSTFEWGETDCALFVAGAIEAITGEDPATEFRGRYTTEMGAARALIKYGAGTLEATMDAKFGQIEVPFAQRGDIVMHEGATGVVIGAEALFIGRGGGQEGLVRIPRADWQKAWRIG